MESHYDATAEYHEVHMPAAWERLRDLMRDAFGDIGSDGVVADIGAGSGLGCTTLADVSDAEIIALEPNTTMRSMMVARLDQAGLLERVTVLPQSVPEGLSRLPERVDGVIVAHMLGHLSEPEQVGLLDWVATSLARGRCALLTVSADVPADGRDPVLEERTVGRLVYRATHYMPGPGRYQGLFEVIDQQQRVIRSVRDAISWEPVSGIDIQTALAGYPVAVTEPQPGVVKISRV